jgi:hypothetical protein
LIYGDRDERVGQLRVNRVGLALFSFDHLVGAPQQIERDGNAKGLRSLEVDD